MRGRMQWLGILIPLGLGFVLSVGLAYQTWDAARRHRAAAEATVHDHVSFAAHLLAGRVDRRLSGAMLFAFYYVDLAIRNGERWPTVEALAADQELARCEEVLPPSDRVFFRWVNDELDIFGPADPALRDWLETWVPETAAAAEGERPFGLRFGAPGVGASGLAYRVFRTPEGIALYGLDNCFRDRAGNVFQASIAESGVLPPTLVGDTPYDSLFSLSVLNGEDEPVWGRPPADYAGFVGRAEVEPSEAYGGLSLVLRLRPATAERLVIGGIPRSRLPEALGLVVLTALLLGIAARQLRRGQELVRLREQFVANVSHELRTPLQQILLFTDLLRLRRVSSNADKEHAVTVIHRETRRLIHLVENVLSFSRPDRPTVPNRKSETALLALAGTVAESFQPIADERGVLIEVTGHEVVVRGEAEALQRVLLNLIDNAVKYGPEGQTVRIEVARRASSGVVTVCDEGPGIPAAHRSRVWKEYYRLGHDAQANRTGQGIGLTIVRDLVERVGGRVSVGDGARGGACLEVEIPMPP